ncbi:MAG: hypothetical protein R3C05_03185 [Pirellulaceae bacterium]
MADPRFPADEHEEDIDRDVARRPRFQISIRTMLLITAVFSVMSAGLFHASRIPVISDELAALSGRGSDSRGPDRMMQIVFIMFTYSMPLLMAFLLAMMSTVWQYFNRRR